MPTPLRWPRSGFTTKDCKGTKRASAEAIFSLGVFAYMPKPVDFTMPEHIVTMACGST